MAKVKHDHNGIYTHKEVCTEKHNATSILLKNQQYQINANRDEVKAINRKINATLIFAISTLLGIIFLIWKG